VTRPFLRIPAHGYFTLRSHSQYPDKMLASNLSPSFNWDTTGMSDEQMRRFPEELGKLGFVFNFITYGGHQIDGLAAEEFATALKQDGMLALARLQRKFRLLESTYRMPSDSGQYQDRGEPSLSLRSGLKPDLPEDGGPLWGGSFADASLPRQGRNNSV
jgi:Isocitrate lyase family